MGKNKLVESIYFDCNLLINNGNFWGRRIAWNVPEDYKQRVDRIVPGNNDDGSIFIVNEDYGSLFVDIYVKGGISWSNANIAWASNKNSESFLISFINQLKEVRELVNIELPNPKLFPLFYREQYTATMAILENFLYSMILREMIFNRVKLLQNIRTYNYGADYLGFERLVKKSRTDDELYLSISDKVMHSMVYHNFDKVSLLYKIIFRENISNEISVIAEDVKIRHNIVHRNGREFNGEPISINRKDVCAFIHKAEEIIENIWNRVKENH